MEEPMQNHHDRLSALPDALLHHIFSSLPMSEIVHTSILSNRYKSLWLSTPNLDFDLDYWMKDREYGTPWVNGRNSFMNFVEKVLFSRDNSNIFKFRLYSYDHDFDFDLPRVSSWLLKILSLNVQHIVLRFPLAGFGSKPIWLGLKLPTHLFSSSVRDLEISFCPNPLVQLPDICSTSRIKDLFLHGVKLPEGNVDGEFILSCGFLEDLSIDFCDANHLKVITISAPILKKLHIRLFIDRKVAHRVNVRTHTRNLDSLSFVSSFSRNDVSVDFDIVDELLSLVSATIYIFNQVNVVEEYHRCLMKILPKVCNAEKLDFGICSKQFLEDFPLSLEGLPYRFHNLKYVKLLDNIDAPLRAMLNFLSCFPHIESLVWSMNLEMEVAPNVAEEPEMNSLLLECKFTCLKTVEIVNFQGVERELKFLAFILERALLLMKVIIKCKPKLSDEKVADFQEKFSSFSRTSPNVSLTLLQKPKYYHWY